MPNVFERAGAYAPAPICGDEDLSIGFLIEALVAKGSMPRDLKAELLKLLQPWYAASVADDDLPWDGFDQLYREWLAQEPVIDAAEYDHDWLPALTSALLGG